MQTTHYRADQAETTVKRLLLEVADHVARGQLPPEVLRIIDRQLLHSPATEDNPHPPGWLNVRYTALVRSAGDDELTERARIRAALATLSRVMRVKRLPDDPAEWQRMAATLCAVCPPPATVDPPADPVPPQYLGDGRVRIGGETVCLEGNEADIVETLVILGAANIDELRKVADNVPRVLNRIREKYPLLAPHIISPGAKGRGGYRTTIVDGRRP